MSDSAVIVKTRKFKRNPLLSRRQVSCVAFAVVMKENGKWNKCTKRCITKKGYSYTHRGIRRGKVKKVCPGYYGREENHRRCNKEMRNTLFRINQSVLYSTHDENVEWKNYTFSSCVGVEEWFNSLEDVDWLFVVLFRFPFHFDYLLMSPCCIFSLTKLLTSPLSCPCNRWLSMSSTQEEQQFQRANFNKL